MYKFLAGLFVIAAIGVAIHSMHDESIFEARAYHFNPIWQRVDILYTGLNPIEIKSVRINNSVNDACYSDQDKLINFSGINAKHINAGDTIPVLSSDPECGFKIKIINIETNKGNYQLIN